MTVKNATQNREVPYQAIVIVSPNVFGEEQKDQDRARWHGPGQVGSVCDGVTSSPRSQVGAELVTWFAPILFKEDVSERLRTVCDLLMTYREEFQATQLTMPDDVPEAMQNTLRKVLREKQANSYQTTIVAVHLRPGRSDVGVEMLRCGDSGVLAFSGDGELLYSSVAHMPPNERERHHPFTSDEWRFGPGDHILVRVEGSLADHSDVAANSGVQERHFGNWLVCTAVDASSSKKKDEPTRPGAVRVARGERLLVPKYLYGQQLTNRGQRYRYLNYSSTIRIGSRMAPDVLADGIEHQGSLTAVLPDHFYSGHYDYVEDRFPRGTYFVLCSDGFYSAFARASEIWAWLQENKDVLPNVQAREPKLRALHQQLHEKGGDDDMSLVWIYPAPARAGQRSRRNSI